MAILVLIRQSQRGGREAIVGSVCGFKRPRPGLPSRPRVEGVAFSPVSNGGGRLARPTPETESDERDIQNQAKSPPEDCLQGVEEGQARSQGNPRAATRRGHGEGNIRDHAVSPSRKEKKWEKGRNPSPPYKGIKRGDRYPSRFPEDPHPAVTQERGTTRETAKTRQGHRHVSGLEKMGQGQARSQGNPHTVSREETQ